MKWITIVLATLLLATNAAWLYLAADQASARKYQQQERYEARQRIAILERACGRLFGGMASDSAAQLLGELAPGDEVFEKEGRLNTTWLSLRTAENGQISQADPCQ